MNLLQEVVTDRNTVQHFVRILSVPFRAMCYVNYGRYMAENEAPEGEILRMKWKNNVEFYHTDSWRSVTSFGSYMLAAVTALRNLKYSEHLFVDYSISYEFN